MTTFQPLILPTLVAKATGSATFGAGASPASAVGPAKGRRATGSATRERNRRGMATRFMFHLHNAGWSERSWHTARGAALLYRRAGPCYAMTPLTTEPLTSVRRKSRPL